MNQPEAMGTVVATSVIRRALPYSREQLFDLVADVERYHEFVPWWRSARIRNRKGDVLDVDQVVAVGGVRVRFASEALLMRPARLRVRSTDGPFRLLDLAWDFAEAPRRGTVVTLTLAYEMRSRLLAALCPPVLFDGFARRIIAAFERRAAQLYGAGDGTGRPGQRRTGRAKR